jgi:hypothetical protein
VIPRAWSAVTLDVRVRTKMAIAQRIIQALDALPAPFRPRFLT